MYFFLGSRESKRPHKFFSYVSLMRKIIDLEPSTCEEVAKKKVWNDVMMMCGKWFWREVCGDFQVDLQDHVCCIWKHREVQSEICG
jgi:hypothetical protein